MKITKDKQVKREVDKEVDIEFYNKVDKEMGDMVNLEVTIKGKHKTTNSPPFSQKSKNRDSKKLVDNLLLFSCLFPEKGRGGGYFPRFLCFCARFYFSRKINGNPQIGVAT